MVLGIIDSILFILYALLMFIIGLALLLAVIVIITGILGSIFKFVMFFVV